MDMLYFLMCPVTLRKRMPHYGWLIVAAGTLCIFACLGLGRFTLGMILPSMATSLSLTYSEMGLISTGNFLGYLISVFVSGMMVRRIGARALIFIALLMVGVSMILLSRASGFIHCLIVYFITGLGSGSANVPMMGLVAAWFKSGRRGRAAGFIVIGSGFAIILSGMLIPYINSLKGGEGWRTGWVMLGLIVLIVAILCLMILRNRPEDKGLEPIGEDRPIESNKIRPVLQGLYNNRVIYHLGIIYFLFGFTYVIYVTFFVTSMVKERGLPEAVAGNFWSAIGLFSLLSGPVFGSLSDKIGRKKGLIIVFILQSLSYILIAIKLPIPFLYLSIFLFGICAWSIPSIMAATVGDYVGPVRAAEAFGFITFIFGLGQIGGPAIAGLLAEASGTFASSFFMASLFAGLAAIIAFFL
jgi:MFS family permease